MLIINSALFVNELQLATVRVWYNSLEIKLENLDILKH